MYFQKIRHPSNFSFIRDFDKSSGVGQIDGQSYRFDLLDLGSEMFRLQVISGERQQNLAQSNLLHPPPRRARCRVEFGPSGEISLIGKGEETFLQSMPGQAFGVCGEAWMLTFKRDLSTQFYGMGEKNVGFERSGLRTKFWNTDIWADFSRHEMREGVTDPMYASIPYLLVKRGNRYVGLLIDNPFPAYMDTGSTYVPVSAGVEPRQFYLGAPHGLVSVYFLVGPSLPELTRKLQLLCGTTPLPPLWSIGHHQCRWGYRSIRDLEKIEAKFERYRIPNDGLWLDIDYMDGFRVFTFDPQHFKDPAREIAVLRGRGHHVVPILDPGVKLDPGYSIYDDGRKAGAFCKNPQGKNFVGFVWPGKSVFPDFSLPEARNWWTEHVRRFLRSGVSGLWLDMNDPAVGPVELDDMLFAGGKLPHAAYHNQYGLAMAEATRAAFARDRPTERPFLLARSAFTGQSKYSAVWTGDNYSNWHHLKNAVPVSLNLALSGMPFNGPDVPGFGGEADASLAEAWYKAGFLFPFLRNHCHQAFGPKEPWNFGEKTRQVCSHYIRTRYKLLPYLYNLFIDQEEHGEAILRPLFYDFRDVRRLPLGKIDDQFLVGPAILQAPVYEQVATSRNVILPGQIFWYAAHEARWIAGGRRIVTRQTRRSTPLFVRELSIVPMQRGIRRDNRNDLSVVELHVFLKRTSQQRAVYTYNFDDGISYDYRKGKRTSFRIEAKVQGKSIKVAFRSIRNNFRAAKVLLVIYDKFENVEVRGLQKRQTLALNPARWNFVGIPLPVWRTPEILIG